MQRLGRRNRAHYRFVVTDARNKREGRYLERIGHYDPAKKDADKLTMDLERFQFWVARGAQPSEAVAALLKQRRVKLPPAPAATH
jgi:small subunit ribosomal protein S16